MYGFECLDNLCILEDSSIQSELFYFSSCLFKGSTFECPICSDSSAHTCLSQQQNSCAKLILTCQFSH